jgi:ATP-dependent protease HslVU (ClpYQ) ATPase subunit
MAYLSEEELHVLGFKYLGKNVKISDKACIYNPEKITIDENLVSSKLSDLIENVDHARYIL